MKKYVFFQIGIFVSLLIPICQIYGQIVPKFGSVQLTYPLENSVFQQNTSGNANISFAGQILKGTYYTPSQLNNFAIQIQQYDYASGSWTNNSSYVYSIVLENCKLPNGDPCSNDPTIDPKTFYLNGNNITTLSKGWYRAAIGYNTNLRATCGTTTKFIPLTAWSTFGVGDVYVVAGQSNASGYDDFNEDDLDPFYNTGTMNNMARVISFDSDKSKVQYVPPVIPTLNDQERVKKGLPYNSDANSIFSVPSISPVGTERTLMALVYLLEITPD